VKKHTPRTSPLFACLALCLASPLVASTSPLPGDPDRWIRVEMNSFTMIASTPEKKTIALGRQLERLQAVLDLLTPEGRERTSTPLRVYVFDRSEPFAPYKPIYRGETLNVSGWFVSVADGAYLAADGSVPPQRLQVHYHELVHAWLSANEPLAPLWIHEGLAEYFSTFTVEDDVLVLGVPIDHHLERLRRGRPLSPTRIMSLGADAPEYNETERQSMYYAQCWALVHMLMSDRERRQAMQEFLRRVHEGELPVHAIETSFGVSFDVLLEQSREHAQQKDLRTFRIPADRVAALDHEPVVVRIGEVEALVELGDLIVRLEQARPGLAQLHFDAALARDPGAARARRGLAMVHVNAGRRAEAIEELERALALDPGFSDAHVQLGWMLVDDWMRGKTHVDDELVEKAPAPLLRARSHFEAAVQVQPDLPMAQAGIGVTYVLDRDPADGIAAMQRAVEAMPWRSDLLAHHVRLLANGGRLEEARALLDHELRRRGSREYTDFGETAVVNAELRETGRLLDRNQVSAAIALLTRAMETTEEPRIRTLLVETLERVARAAGAKSTSSEVQRFVVALDALAADRFAEAREIAEKLARSARNARLRERAAELLVTIEQAESLHGAVQRYAEAVELVARGQVEEARKVLRRLLQRPGLDEEIADRVHAFLDELGG
jgi:tetratricopeptide (TPR) repeat protein